MSGAGPGERARLRVRGRIAVLASCLSLLVMGCTPADPPPAAVTPRVVPSGTPVSSALLGTHVGGISSGTQSLPTRAGAIRLWDSGVSWRQLEPRRGQINWAQMDRAVSQAESTGAKEIIWVHGSTPIWAAQDPDSRGLYGPGSSSQPKTSAYLGILRQVATRYKGRITAYQVWNEANLKIFYRGTPAKMAKLTAGAQEVLDEVDPSATLVGASTTMRRSGPVKSWYADYLEALDKLEWPVDVLSVHLYPIADQGAGTRAAYIRMIKPWLAKRGWTGPVWDTEVNYGDRRDFAPQIVVVPQTRAVAWVARTYIDSLALGIDRVFWYSWNDHLLGIDQVDPQTGAILPAGKAYLTLQQWFTDAWWQGCAGELMKPTGDLGAMTTCSLQYGTGQRGQILFSHGAATSIPTPTGVRDVCRLDGSCSVPTGDELVVGTEPQLVRFSG